MKSIFTKYLPSSNNKPSRIKAFDSEKKFSVTVSRDAYDSLELAHLAAVKKLKDKLKWSGKMVCGDSGNITNGMVCVFEENTTKVNPIKKSGKTEKYKEYSISGVTYGYGNKHTEILRMSGKNEKDTLRKAKKHLSGKGLYDLSSLTATRMNPVKKSRKRKFNKNPVDPFTKKRVRRKSIKQKAGGTVSYPTYKYFLAVETSGKLYYYNGKWFDDDRKKAHKFNNMSDVVKMRDKADKKISPTAPVIFKIISIKSK